MTRKPLALYYISHVSVGVHPPDITVMGIMEWEA